MDDNEDDSRGLNVACSGILNTCSTRAHTQSREREGGGGGDIRWGRGKRGGWGYHTQKIGPGQKKSYNFGLERARPGRRAGGRAGPVPSHNNNCNNNNNISGARLRAAVHDLPAPSRSPQRARGGTGRALAGSAGRRVASLASVSRHAGGGTIGGGATRQRACHSNSPVLGFLLCAPVKR